MNDGMTFPDIISWEIKRNRKRYQSDCIIGFSFSYLQNVGHHQNQFIVILDFIAFAMDIYSVLFRSCYFQG